MRRSLERPGPPRTRFPAQCWLLDQQRRSLERPAAAPAAADAPTPPPARTSARKKGSSARRPDSMKSADASAGQDLRALL